MGDRLESIETYGCMNTCFVDGESVHSRRSAWRCSLLTFPESNWGPVENCPSPHMGRLPVQYGGRSDVGDDPMRPGESHEDGCPGGWYRSPFVISLLKYERHFLGDSFCENLTLTRCDDRLVLEATHRLEQERLRARSHEDERTRKWR